MNTIILDESFAEDILSVERACFSPPWELSVIVGTLRQKSYRYFGVVDGGRLCAYSSVTVICDECYVNRVAVLPACRKNGLGDLLMTAMINSCRAEGGRFLSLEVRRSNLAAISLYKKHGFETHGERRDFYSSPREDALIMTKQLNTPADAAPTEVNV